MLNIMQGFFLMGRTQGGLSLQAASPPPPRFNEPNWPAWTRRESALCSSAEINNAFARRLRETTRRGGEKES